MRDGDAELLLLLSRAECHVGFFVFFFQGESWEPARNSYARPGRDGAIEPVPSCHVSLVFGGVLSVIRSCEKGERQNQEAFRRVVSQRRKLGGMSCELSEDSGANDG